MPDGFDFKAWLKDLRSRVGAVTQEELAEALGVHRSSVARWETTHARPRFNNMQKLHAFEQRKLQERGSTRSPTSRSQTTSIQSLVETPMHGQYEHGESGDAETTMGVSTLEQKLLEFFRRLPAAQQTNWVFKLAEEAIRHEVTVSQVGPALKKPSEG